MEKEADKVRSDRNKNSKNYKEMNAKNKIHQDYGRKDKNRKGERETAGGKNARNPKASANANHLHLK